MNEADAFRIFTLTGAIHRDGHFVYKAEEHGTTYVDWKTERAHKYIKETNLLCRGLAERFAGHGIEAVVGVATGGTFLSQLVRHHLVDISRDRCGALTPKDEEAPAYQDGVLTHGGEVLAYYMEKGTKELVYMSYDQTRYLDPPVRKWGQGNYLKNLQVLIVDDVLTTGTSVKAVADVVRFVGGNIVSLGVLCNRGNVTKKDVGIPEVFELVNFPLEGLSEEECMKHGPCSRGVPVNTELGHGKEFLAKKRG